MESMMCASVVSINPLGFVPKVWFLRLRGGRWRKRRRGLGRCRRDCLFRRWRSGGLECRQCRRLLDRPGRDSWPLPLNKIRLFGSLLCQRKAYRRDPILLLDETAQRLKSGDFRAHDEWFGGDLQSKGFLAPEQAHAAGLFQALDLDLADSFGNPLGGAWLGSLQKHLRRGLREHGLGVLAVAFFHLAAALKPHHNRVPVLAVFGEGGMKLWQLVEAGQLVNDEPNRLYLGVFAVSHHAQNEQVQPHGMERQNLLPVAGAGGQKNPSPALGVPLGRRECLAVRFVPFGQQFQAVGNHIQAGKNACPLRGGGGVDEGGKRGSLHHQLDPFRVGHPLQNVSGLRLFLEQTGQNPARPIGKKRLLILLVWKERGGDGGGGFLTLKLIAQSPIRTPGVKRIQDQVAALWIVELAYKVHRRVVDDGALSALLDLAQELPDGGRLAAAGVAQIG